MTATLIVGQPTGRVVRTYINSGTHTTPTWTEIVKRSGDKYTPGKKNLFQTETFEQRKKLQAEGSADPDKYTFTYKRVKGVSDTAWSTIAAACVPGGPIREIAICDDDITAVGATYRKFPGCWSFVGEDRDLGKFVEQDIEVDEVMWYAESGTVLIAGSDVTVT